MLARCAPMLRKVGNLLCQSRVAQEWMARRASQLERCFRKPLPIARRAASYGASHTFIVHVARCAEQ
ncbi:hypothetical protein A2U01_0063016, partial [Trifolium medium]|nr:hypothetical protein [Trifolium medium]